MGLDNNLNYLESDACQKDPWCIKCIKETDAEALADLLLARITHPANNGPVFDTFPNELDFANHRRDSWNIDGDLEAEIIYDMVCFAIIDWDLFTSAMGVLMSRIMSTPLRPLYRTLENVFYLSEAFCLNSVSEELFKWLKERKDLLNSTILAEENIYLKGLAAYSQAQNKEEGCYDFWLNLWNSSDRKVWKNAWLGLRYHNVQYALAQIPLLIERKCVDASVMIASLWRTIDKEQSEKVDEFIKTSFNKKERWFGLAINDSAYHLTLLEKKKLMNRLNKLVGVVEV